MDYNYSYTGTPAEFGFHPNWTDEQNVSVPVQEQYVPEVASVPVQEVQVIQQPPSILISSSLSLKTISRATLSLSELSSLLTKSSSSSIVLLIKKLFETLFDDDEFSIL
jgi:hypothetical protein